MCKWFDLPFWRDMSLTKCFKNNEYNIYSLKKFIFSKKCFGKKKNLISGKELAKSGIISLIDSSDGEKIKIEIIGKE